MAVTFPIISPADGEVLDPAWCSDVTEAVNTLRTDTDGLELQLRPQSAYSASASSAIGTTITAILTLTGCVLTTGRAYSVENVGGVVADTTGRYADFALFKTSTAGTQLAAFFRTPQVGGPGVQTNCYGKVYIRNSTAANLTFDLVLSIVASAGTVTHYATSTFLRSLVVTDVGAATDWPLAFAVT